LFKNFVLGAGVSGLILSYLLQIPAIGQLQGQSYSNFSLGPRILHKDEYAELLLRKLGIRNKPRIFKIGHYEGNLIDGNFVNPGQSWRDSYAKKTRGITDFASAASGGKSEIIGWDIAGINLIKKLREEKALVILTHVSEIDIPQKIVYVKSFEDSGMCIYDELFSTISLKEFYRIAGENEKARALELGQVRFLLVNSTMLNSLIGDFDYVYFASEEIPFNRITRVGRFEFVVEIPEQNLGKGIVMSEAIVRRSVIIASQIIPKDWCISNPYLKNEDKVHMVGRYAKWDHSLLINDVIREGLAYAKDLCIRY
jgi:hypothetical protein